MMLLFTGWFGYELGRRSMRPPVQAVRLVSPMDTKRTRMLADAVDEFNRYAQFDPIGKTRPPLTEDEVVAAIRGWKWTRKEHPVTEPVFQTFQTIAETRKLPPGAGLQSCSGWDTGPQGYKFEV